MRGEEKEFTTVWLTLGQRTLRYETYVMPAPTENTEELYELLLRRNEKLVGARFSIGVEDAIFLRGELFLSSLTEGELDRIIGTLYSTVEQCFKPLLRIGFSSKFISAPHTSFPAPELTAVGEDVKLTRAHLCNLSEMNPSSISFIGGGNMGAALVGGLINSGWDSSLITVVELSDARRAELHQMFPDVSVSDALVSCESVVIAVKPPAAADACKTAAAAGARRVLSIAAGISIDTLQRACGDSVVVIRAMPNTPALVGQGAAAISFSARCTEPDIVWAETVLGSVGTVVRVPEQQMDAVTAISGSGPAYVFLLAEALIVAAVNQGLSPEVADGLVRQLLVGSAALLAASSETPAAQRERVTSPRGTTAAAIEALELAGFREAIAAAVEAAIGRSRQLGA
jgi:pyrroline-5-carboxylate reductase